MSRPPRTSASAGAADAVAFHRLPHHIVDRSVGHGPGRRAPGQRLRLVALREDGGEARLRADPAGLNRHRPVTLGHGLVKDLLVAGARQLVTREPVAEQVVAEDRRVVVVGRDRDLNGRARAGTIASKRDW